LLPDPQVTRVLSLFSAANAHSLLDKEITPEVSWEATAVVSPPKSAFPQQRTLPSDLRAHIAAYVPQTSTTPLVSEEARAPGEPPAPVFPQTTKLPSVLIAAIACVPEATDTTPEVSCELTPSQEGHPPFAELPHTVRLPSAFSAAHTKLPVKSWVTPLVTGLTVVVVPPHITTPPLGITAAKSAVPP
jgi:hypothetical protein